MTSKVYCGITNERNCKCLNHKIPKVSAMQVDLKSVMRKLFSDHGNILKYWL